MNKVPVKAYTHDMSKCPWCDYAHANLDSLRIHSNKKHKQNSEALYLGLFTSGVKPTCACGCGEVPKFLKLQEGYSKYRPGHHSRIHNNWGHNKEALEKSQNVRREQIVNGEWKVWNKGEIKETNEAIAVGGRNCSITLKTNPECQKQRSEHMKGQWEKNEIIPLTGAEHPNWKGGVSSVQQLARSYVHNVWTFPKLKEEKFTCQHCHSQENLCVHHDGERFAEILQKARTVLGDVTDFESITRYAEWIAQYHVVNDVSGIVLCESCHAEEHANLNSSKWQN